MMSEVVIVETEKWTNLTYFSEVKLSYFADRLDTVEEENRGI